eukprot:sb/3477723/
MQCSVPSADRQLCVALLLELAVQRGDIIALLDFAFISLRLSRDQAAESNRITADKTVHDALLVPGLTKLANVEGPPSFSGPPAEFIQENQLPNNAMTPVALKTVGN